MFVSDQLEGTQPDVGGSELCPVERDGFVEPDAVVFQAPEARHSSQEKDEQLGQGGGPDALADRGQARVGSGVAGP